MASKIIFKKEVSLLTEDFTDIGYMAEDFEVIDENNEILNIKKSSPNRNLQLFISYPSFEDFKEDIIKVDEFLQDAKVKIHTFLIFSHKFKIPYKFKALKVIFDEKKEFAQLYGTQIVSGNLENKLTKALFLIGKDGAIYHIDMPENLAEPFNLEYIRLSLNKAYQSYTGVTCHA